MKIISYHPNKSTGIGGVETLIRSLQEIATEGKVQFYEIFHSICGSEYFDETPEAHYEKLHSYSSLPKKLQSIFKKLSTYRKITEIAKNESGAIIIFDPRSLFCIPNSVSKKYKIIVVQTNKFEVTYSALLSKIAILTKSSLISRYSVYTQEDKNKLSKLYPVLSKKIEIIPRGCKIPTKAIPSKISTKIVTIARIDESQKNFDSMIRIVSSLPEDYTLDIYGDGEKDEVVELRGKIANYPRISYRGPTKEVESTLSNYSTFIMTSHHEGFGQTLIEARSQGLPIVAFNTFDALPWIVREGINGHIIPPGDEYEFSKKIIEATSSRENYAYLSKNAIELAKETEMQAIKARWKTLIGI